MAKVASSRALSWRIPLLLADLTGPLQGQKEQGQIMAGQTPEVKLNEHWQAGCFKSYKRMVGGYRFYFPAADPRDPAARDRAELACFQVCQRWQQLEAAGLTSWPAEALLLAKQQVKAICRAATAPQRAAKALKAATAPIAHEALKSLPIGDGEMGKGAMGRGVGIEFREGGGGSPAGRGVEAIAHISPPLTHNYPPLDISPPQSLNNAPVIAAPIAIDPTTALDDAIPFENGAAIGHETLTHTALRAFKAEQRIRLDTKDIGDEQYRTCTSQADCLLGLSCFRDITLSSFNRDALLAVVNYWKKRPLSSRGKPYSVQSVKNAIGFLRQFCNWLYATEQWEGFRNWGAVFAFDSEKLKTAAEEDEAGKPIPTFSVPELVAIWGNASKPMRLYILLALNCAMTQKEIATLRPAMLKGLDSETPYLERLRNKTKIPGRWPLWPETVEALKGQLAPGDNPHGLALLTRMGFPLKHYSPNGCQTDSILLAWTKLMRALKKRKTPDANLERIAVRNGAKPFQPVQWLGFKYIRKTSGNLVSKIAGFEIGQVHLSQRLGQAERGKSVAEGHYLNRDFEKLAEALAEVRLLLLPMLTADKAIEAAEGK